MPHGALAVHRDQKEGQSDPRDMEPYYQGTGVQDLPQVVDAIVVAVIFMRIGGVAVLHNEASHASSFQIKGVTPAKAVTLGDCTTSEQEVEIRIL